VFLVEQRHAGQRVDIVLAQEVMLQCRWLLIGLSVGKGLGQLS
jgi:hypothetical protein